jgi:hypothetical protein
MSFYAQYLGLFSASLIALEMTKQKQYLILNHGFLNTFPANKKYSLY